MQMFFESLRHKILRARTASTPLQHFMNGTEKTKRILVRVLKIFGWILLSVILLLIVVALAIQLPPVQNRLVQKAISFLEQKIGTKVSLDHISISFPKAI